MDKRDRAKIKILGSYSFYKEISLKELSLNNNKPLTVLNFYGICQIKGEKFKSGLNN